MRYRLRWSFLAAVIFVYAIFWKLTSLDYAYIDEFNAAFFLPNSEPGDSYDIGAPSIVVSFGDAWSALPEPRSCHQDSSRLPIAQESPPLGQSWFHHDHGFSKAEPGTLRAPIKMRNRASLNASLPRGNLEPAGVLSPALQSQLWYGFQKAMALGYNYSHAHADGGETGTEKCLSLPRPWNERLCHDFLGCLQFKTYAPAGRFIAVNHSDPAYNSIQSSIDLDDATAKDLLAQIEEWLAFIDERKWTAPEELHDVNKTDWEGDYNSSVLFTVWAGMGESRIAASVKSPGILLPHVLDVTLLPSFRDQISSPSAIAPLSPSLSLQIFKQACFLSRYWNQGLELRARNFKAGQIMTWKVDDWLAGEIRLSHDRRRKETGFDVGGSSGGGSPATGQSRVFDADGFAEVDRPCVIQVGEGWKVCKDEKRHLMWNNMHLSSAAHGKLAMNAAQLVVGLWLSEESYLHPPSRLDQWELLKSMGMKGNHRLLRKTGSDETTQLDVPS
ncbi:hypothetical protein DRE_03287 [Drechslerella stenobrocha 248]|uniref:Uncharacterized protein n=1 Tax=Drechslerella stenobrocha 248 TaxID=1043628 RepID=W7I5D0_9PEZI|nr:hypothetical protein DRE_03287 [Drechslerella stenobrocha 248]